MEIPDDIVYKLITAESNGNPNAVSPAGARGYAQFMPATAKQYGVDPADFQSSFSGAKRYLSDLSNQFGGDLRTALQAYNWGPGNMQAYLKTGAGMKGQPMPAETRAYVDRVLRAKPTAAPVADLGAALGYSSGGGGSGAAGGEGESAGFDLGAALGYSSKKDKAVDVPASPMQEFQSSVAGRLIQGLRDPIDALAQAAPRGLSYMMKAFTGGMPNFNTKLLDSEAKRVDEMVRKNEKQYDAARAVTGETGFDAMRLVGNVANPVNYVMAAGVPAAVTTKGKIAANALAGAGFGLTSPVTSGDYGTEKAKQIAISAAASGAMAPIVEKIARVVNPNVSPEVKALMAEGVTPTPGQILGGAAQRTEDKLTSLPFMGDAIISARQKAIGEFNKAAYQRALNPIGANAVGPVGWEGLAEVRTALGNAYKELTPRLRFAADNQFKAEMSGLSIPKSQQRQFQKIVSEQIDGKVTPYGLMNGEQFKGAESQLTRMAKGYQSSSDFDQRQLGDALAEVLAAMRRSVVRNAASPADAARLQKINEGWANYARLRQAAASQGAAGNKGVFSPAQLSSAVKAGDMTVGDRAFSEGTALMQDLSGAGKSVLGSQYPDSGTAGRAMMGLAMNPVMWPKLAGGVALGAIGSVPYMPGARNVTAAVLAKRPKSAETLADLIRKLGPASAPIGIPLSQLVVNNGAQ